MNWLDWLIVIFYMAGLLIISMRFGRNLHDTEGYYAGGRKMPWYMVGLSLLVSQWGIMPLISIPAVVALAPSAGLRVLTVESAIPLSMVLILPVIFPLFRRLNIISVYEYLEGRFGKAVKIVFACLFLIIRSILTAVGVYVSALFFSFCTGLPLWMIILVICLFVMVCNAVGGMKGVIYSDGVTALLIMSGAGICLGYALIYMGGLNNAMTVMASESSKVLDLSEHGFGDCAILPFWGVLTGGFLFYAFFYGCDQAQVQKEISCNADNGKNPLMMAGFLHYPVTVLLTLVGIALGAFAISHTEFRNTLAGYSGFGYILPGFAMNHIHHGARAVVFCAVLAGAVSWLNQGLISLSAVTVRDFLERGILQDCDSETLLRWSRITTVSWGLISAVLSLVFSAFGLKTTLVENVFILSVIFCGPVLSVFLMGSLSGRVTAMGALAGLAGGILFGVTPWLLLKDKIFWMWWGVIGFIIAVALCLAVSLLQPAPDSERIRKYILWENIQNIGWNAGYTILILYSAGIVGVLYYLPFLTGHGR